MNRNILTTLLILCFFLNMSLEIYACDPLVISIEEYTYYNFGQVDIQKEVIVNVTSGTVDMPNGWSYTGEGVSFNVLEKTGTILRLGVTASTVDIFTIQIDAHSTLNGDDSDSFDLKVADISVSCPPVIAYGTGMDIDYSIDAPVSITMPVVYVLDSSRDTMFVHLVASEEGEFTYNWNGKGSSSGPYSGVYLPEGAYIAGFVACAGFRAEQNFTIVKVEMINPTGDPTNPSEAEDNVNEFTFNGSSTGHCFIKCEAQLTPDNEQTQEWAESNVVWSIGPGLETSIIQWGDYEEGDFTEADNKGKIVWIHYAGLPFYNSEFGKHTISLSVPGADIIVSDIEVFYTKTATNNPGGSSPNWFYYWNQAEGLGDSDAGYYPGLSIYGRTPAMYFWNFYETLEQMDKNHIMIFDKVATKNIQPDNDETHGIDCFADTIKHEKVHIGQIHDADALLTQNGTGIWEKGWSWNGSPDNHYNPGDPIVYLDSDHDDIPNAWDWDPNDPNDGDDYLEGNSGDAKQAEDTNDGDFKQYDWGSPGKNYGDESYE